MKRVHTIGNKFLYMVMIALVTACLSIMNARVFAAGETFTGGSNKTGLVNTEIPIDDLQISGASDLVVTINLHVPNSGLVMTDVSDLISYTEGRIITATGTVSALNDALASLTFTSDEYTTTTLTASIVRNEKDVYNPYNGHVYRIVEAGGEGVNWSEAKSAAESATYGELPGYLATLTQEEESLLILHDLTGDAWVGGTDDPAETDDQEGEWYWTTEPTGPIHFWSGDETGGPVDEDLFINWETNIQPDNDSGAENCLELVSAQVGLWNDAVCANTQSHYVVEFGANGFNPDVPTKQLTITTTAPTVEVDSCEELQAVDEEDVEMLTIEITGDIDCQNQTMEPLFNDNSFAGQVNGNGHTIRNVVIEEDNTGVGLFSTAYDSSFSDLTIENISVTGEESVGGLVGYTQNTTITNVHLKDIDVSATHYGYAGGLVGDYYVDEKNSSIIEDVSATGSMTAEGEEANNIGGLIGYVQISGDLRIEKVYTDVAVSAPDTDESSSASDIGGMFGELEAYPDDNEHLDMSITVQDVYAWGNITAPTAYGVGGLVGHLDTAWYDEVPHSNIDITRAYARGKVTGWNEVGGLIGTIDDLGEEEGTFYSITSSFAMGRVSAVNDEEDEDMHQGAIVGSMDGTGTLQTLFEDVYFDQTRTGQSDCNNNEDINDCSAVNVSNAQPLYFINNTENPPFDDWNFNNLWVMNEDVPPTFEAYELGEDLNGDLIPDAEQDHVSGYTSMISGNKVAIDVGEGCTITKDDLEQESAQPVQDDEYNYEHGLFDFAGDCGEPGFTTTINLYFYGADPEGYVLRKYNPNTKEYSTIEDATISQVTIHGSTVTVATYQITDGGELDTDGEVNGSFEDPAGLAILASNSDSNNDGSSSLADTGFGATLIIAVATGLIVIGAFAVRRAQSRA